MKQHGYLAVLLHIWTPAASSGRNALQSAVVFKQLQPRLLTVPICKFLNAAVSTSLRHR